MRSSKLSAIVIKRRNFLEKDRILTLFSLEKGKTEALAKGARRPGNRLSPNTDLGTVAKFLIHRGKSLDIVSEIEPIYHPFGARGEYLKSEKIGYALKLIDKLFEFDEPHPKSYRALVGLVEAVSDYERQLIFLKFLLEVLDDLGALPNFFNCPKCHNEVCSKDEFVFSFEGGLSHLACSDEHYRIICVNEIKILRLLVSDQADKFSFSKVQEETFAKAYKVIEEYITFQFGKILPDRVL